MKSSQRMADEDASPTPNKQRRPASAWDRQVIADLVAAIAALRRELIALEARSQDRLRSVNPAHRAGAANLVHYVGLRRHDVRQLQEQLAWLGLSSLGRAESHVLANLDKVLGLLHILAGEQWSARSEEEPAGSRTGPHLLQEHAQSLLGPHRPGRRTRIMVTLAAEAAHDYALVRGMLAAGMDCARINCAHDNEDVWGAMIANVARARRDLGQSCKVLMDLAGPKLRTGEIAPGPAVLKWRPLRDAFGRVIAPARVFLTAADAPCDAPGADACVPVDARWLAALSPGNQVELTDARGARRTLKVVATAAGGVWAEAAHTAYVTPETVLRVSDGAPDVKGKETRPARIEATRQPLLLRPGDKLVLTREKIPGRSAERDADGRLLRPASIPCTLPEVFGDVHAGERVWLDDGRIGGIIRDVTQGEIHLEITAAREEGERLAADKGINLPDSALSLPALTEKDLSDLDFVAAQADLVGLSFVQRPADVAQAQAQLAGRGREDLGIVLKIETQAAFENLPDLLLTAMRSPRIGVMIARGDLAVELGYERLAEVQEEILWLAEAAHVPLIWATQVLESMAKRGLPSRAEITDAAMGERAECVMLNKGPHILEAVHALDDILLRMEAHQDKKRSMLRRLHW
jgi:pyruvate kinase